MNTYKSDYIADVLRQEHVYGLFYAALKHSCVIEVQCYGTQFFVSQINTHVHINKHVYSWSC